MKGPKSRFDGANSDSPLAGLAFRSGLEKENAVPVGAAGGDIVDIENHVGKPLVEDARLYLERNLRSDEAGFDVAEGAEAARGEDYGHEKGENRTGNGEKADGEEDAFAADAEGSEGDDFAIHGHSAETEEDADEHGHGNGENEDAGNDAEEKSEDLRAGARVADEKFHEADQLGDEENESEDEEAKKCVANDFANNVAIEDAHDEKGQCNMGGELEVYSLQPTANRRETRTVSCQLLAAGFERGEARHGRWALPAQEL